MVFPAGSANFAMAWVVAASRRGIDCTAPSTLPSLLSRSTSTRAAAVAPIRDVGSQAIVTLVSGPAPREYPTQTSAVVPDLGSTSSVSAAVTSRLTGSTYRTVMSSALGAQ